MLLMCIEAHGCQPTDYHNTRIASPSALHLPHDLVRYVLFATLQHLANRQTHGMVLALPSAACIHHTLTEAALFTTLPFHTYPCTLVTSMPPTACFTTCATHPCFECPGVTHPHTPILDTPHTCTLHPTPINCSSRVPHSRITPTSQISLVPHSHLTLTQLTHTSSTTHISPQKSLLTRPPAAAAPPPAASLLAPHRPACAAGQPWTGRQRNPAVRVTAGRSAAEPAAPPRAACACVIHACDIHSYVHTIQTFVHTCVIAYIRPAAPAAPPLEACMCVACQASHTKHHTSGTTLQFRTVKNKKRPVHLHPQDLQTICAPSRP